MSSGPDMLTIDMICKKLNHQPEKNKTKTKRKAKEKGLALYEKLVEVRCNKCRKYGHIFTKLKCPENKEKDKKSKKN